MHALRRVPAVSAACRALSSRAALAPPAAVETSARGRAATLAAAAAVLAGAALALAPSTPKGRQKHSGSETSVSNWRVRMSGDRRLLCARSLCAFSVAQEQHPRGTHQQLPPAREPGGA